MCALSEAPRGRRGRRAGVQVPGQVPRMEDLKSALIKATPPAPGQPAGRRRRALATRLCATSCAYLLSGGPHA